MNRRGCTRDLSAGGVVKGAVAGFLGGLAGAWAMNTLHAMTHRRHAAPQGHGPHEAPAAAGGGGAQPGRRTREEPTTVQAAEAVSRRLFHHPLTEREKPAAGNVVHYAIGAASGAVYGALAEITPVVSDGDGILLGVGLWLAADEVAAPALRLSSPPTDYPDETRADALANHVLYGMTTECVRRIVRAAM